MWTIDAKPQGTNLNNHTDILNLNHTYKDQLNKTEKSPFNWNTSQINIVEYRC